MLKQEEFGRLLAEARKGKEMSRQTVAVALGLDMRFLGNVERGNRLVSVMTLAGLHGLLRFDSDRLLAGLVVSVAGPVLRQRRKVPGARAAGASQASDSESGAVRFGALLADARERAQLTQAVVARAVRCSRRQIIRFERGDALPSLARFAQLWQVLGFDSNVLLAALRGDSPDREPFYGFGEVLAAARVGRSLSRGQVAQAARCAVGDYLAIERGATLPTMAAAVRIHSITEFDAHAALGWVWRSGAMEKLD